MPDNKAQFPVTLCMLTHNEDDRVAASLEAVRDHVERVRVDRRCADNLASLEHDLERRLGVVQTEKHASGQDLPRQARVEDDAD